MASPFYDCCYGNHVNFTVQLELVLDVDDPIGLRGYLVGATDSFMVCGLDQTDYYFYDCIGLDQERALMRLLLIYND